MKARPLPIVLLALLNFLAPVPNILVSAWLEGLTPTEYLNVFLEQSDWFSIFVLLALFPIGGTAIFLVKRWSYWMFMGVAAIATYANIDNWMAFPGYYSYALLILANLVNIGVVSFFLLPQIRAPYFNSSLRWWEPRPRYPIQLDAILWDADGENTAIITDVSAGGVFLHTHKEMKLEDRVFTEFEFHNLKFNLRGRIAHKRELPHVGYGIQFLDLEQNGKAQHELENLVHALDLLGVVPRSKQNLWKKDLSRWFNALFTAKPKGPPPHSVVVWQRPEQKKNEEEEKKRAA